MRPRGYLAVNAAADMAGVDRRSYREKLKAAHEKTGGILVVFAKNPNAQNAKLWTTLAALREADPETFGEVTQMDIMELREMILEDRKRIARIEKKVLPK